MRPGGTGGYALGADATVTPLAAWSARVRVADLLA